MKNLLLFIFAIGSVCVFGQSPFKANLLTSVDYSFSKSIYTYGTFNEELDYEMPIGKSVHLELEYEISPKLSVLGGLRYAHKIMRPRIDLPISYGTALPKDGENIYVSTPYLNKHEFNIIALPLIFKRNILMNNKFKLYASTGVLASFKFKEKESYKVSSEWDIERLMEQGIENNFVYSDDEISLFNTAIEIGLGMSYKLSDKINVLLQTNASVFEMRRGNAKFKKNGDMLWEEKLIPIGQASLGLGLQRIF